MKILPTLILPLMLNLMAMATSAANLLPLQIPKSKHLIDTPSITLALPASYEQASHKTYPVLYALDGNLTLELIAGVLRGAHIAGGANEHIIVGITSGNRLHDFSPTVNQDPRGPLGIGGGGDALLHFLESELMPIINQRYRSNQFNVLLGHSVAGLLVMHSFHSRPTLFQAHMAFSPAVWWGARETATALKHYITESTPAKTYLYMNIGAENGELRKVYDDLAQFMVRNRHVDLTLRSEEYQHEAHDLTLAAGIYSALKGLYQFQKRRL